MSISFEKYEMEFKLLRFESLDGPLGQSSGESAAGRRARQGVERVEVGEIAKCGPVGECVVCSGFRRG